jgi:outer membrane protein assembly factor BamB
MQAQLKVVTRLSICRVLAVLCATSASPAVAQSVTTYHNSINRHAEYVVPGLTAATAPTMHLDPAFNASFSGAVYAQPLYWQPDPGSIGTVIVATETNQVEALNASTGALVWSTQLPASPNSSALQCGNISPEGITGTPAIDPVTGTLYFDALTGTTAATVRHKIYALNANTGAIRPGYPLDVQSALAARGVTFDSTDQGERGAVLFLNGSAYITYGGRSGDCGNYHGMVVQLLPNATPSIAGAWATRAVLGGIWAQGGSASDGYSIYATTGNTSGTTIYGDGESIVRLRSGLAHSTSPINFFAPSNWHDLDDEDADLGGTEALPFLVAGGGPRLIAFGKDGNAYLVNRSNLGGIGGQLGILHVSNRAIITAPAIYNTPSVSMVVFRNAADLTCGGSALTMLSVAATGATPIKQAWCAPLNGAGAPIITTTNGSANPLVWVVGAEGDNLLHGFNALTGQAVFSGGGQSLSGLRHFQTILAANQHLYVAGGGQLYGFVFSK